jgi:hypothetical protein
MVLHISMRWEALALLFTAKTLTRVADQEFFPPIFFEYLYLYISLYALEDTLDNFFLMASLISVYHLKLKDIQPLENSAC